MAFIPDHDGDATLGGVVRAMGAVLFGFGLLSVASGGLFALVGVRLASAGVSSTTIGLVASAYFGGLLAGSLSGGRVITRVGHIRAFAVFAATAAIAVLLLAMTDRLPVWIGLRAAAGYCMAGLFMIMESWLNHRATNTTRGRTFAVYAVVSGTAVACGPLLLNLGSPRDFELFSLTAILYAAALLPVAMTRTGNPVLTPRTRLGLRRLFAISPLGVVGCLAAGLVNSSFYGLAAVYGQAVGLDAGAVAGFMTVTLIGGLLAQFPVGILSDRFDRRHLMLALTVVAAAASATIAGLGIQAWLPLAALGFLWDAAAHPLYGLSVAQTNDYVARDEFVPAAGGLLLAYAVGASIGPLASSTAIGAFGPAGLFAFIAAVLALLAVFTLYRMRRRAPKPLAEQGEFIKVPETTAVSAELDPRGQPSPHPDRPEPRE